MVSILTPFARTILGGSGRTRDEKPETGGRFKAGSDLRRKAKRRQVRL